MKHDGKWLAGKKHGHGITTYNTGLKNEIIFAGNFRDDKLENGGTRTDHNSVYIGDFIDFKRSGNGKLEYLADGKTYTGEFLNDFYHG